MVYHVNLRYLIPLSFMFLIGDGDPDSISYLPFLVEPSHKISLRL